MDKNNYKFVYCGSSEFSTSILASLIASQLIPNAVITKVDKPSGRGLKISQSPLKKYALQNNLPHYEVKNKKEFEQLVDRLQPDFGVVVDFGIIINEQALTTPRLGFINVHPSLLPKYRGTSPIQTAIINGETLSGVSIMKLDKEIDHGPIFAKIELKIELQDNYGSLLKKLAQIGSQELIKVINNLECLKPLEQSHEQATFTQKITVNDCELKLSQPAQKLLNIIRATNPKPGAWIILNNKRLKIYSAHLSDIKPEKDFALQCVDKKFLVIDKLQPEGKKEMSGNDFLNGIR